MYFEFSKSYSVITSSAGVNGEVEGSGAAGREPEDVK